MNQMETHYHHDQKLLEDYMTKKDIEMIQEINRNIEAFTDENVCRNIMKNFNNLKPGSSKKEIADFVKKMMNRLDSSVEKKTRIQIMEKCGINCAEVNKNFIKKFVDRRNKYSSINEFLESENKKPFKGTRLEKDGNIVYHFFTPRSYTTPMRCYCSLLGGLPDDESISSTYCHCSKALVKKLWETVLNKPVKVEFLGSVIAGAEECKFKIYL